MAQVTQLAVGTASATSSNILVASAAEMLIGLFPPANEQIPSDVRATLVQATQGGDVMLTSLDRGNPCVIVHGPGTFRVIRNACSAPGVGVFSDE